MFITYSEDPSPIHEHRWNIPEEPSEHVYAWISASKQCLSSALMNQFEAGHGNPPNITSPEIELEQSSGALQPNFNMLAKCPSEGSARPFQNSNSEGSSEEAGAGRPQDATSALIRSASGTPAVTPRHTMERTVCDSLESPPLESKTLPELQELGYNDSDKRGNKGCDAPALAKAESVRRPLSSIGIFENKETSASCGPSTSGSMSRKTATSARQRIKAPTRQELQQALPLLDMNKDGKIWEDDLNMLVQLAFNVDVSSAPASWQDLKQALQSIDGLISAAPLETAVKIGLVHREAEKMRPLSPKQSRGPKGIGAKESNGYWGPFTSLRTFLEAFNKFDRDKNGVICSRDLKMASALLVGLSISQSECKEIIRQVDANWNGVVDLLEFGALVELLMWRFPDFEALAHVLTADLMSINLSSVAAFLALDVSELDVLMRTAMADFVEVIMQLQQASKMS